MSGIVQVLQHWFDNIAGCSENIPGCSEPRVGRLGNTRHPRRTIPPTSPAWPPGRTAHSNQAGKGAAKCYSFLQDGRPSQFSPLPRKILPHPQADHLHKPFYSISWDVGLCPQSLRGRRGKRLAGIRNWQVISETPGHHRVARASQPASACRSTTSRRLDPRGRRTDFQPLSPKTGDPRQPQDKSRGKGHRSKRNRIKFSKMEVILT